MKKMKPFRAAKLWAVVGDDGHLAQTNPDEIRFYTKKPRAVSRKRTLAFSGHFNVQRVSVRPVQRVTARRGR